MDPVQNLQSKSGSKSFCEHMQNNPSQTQPFMDKPCPQTTSCSLNMPEGLNQGVQRRHPWLRMSKEKFSACKKAGKYKGVEIRKYDRFGARVRDPITGKRCWIGTFDTPEEAEAAYLEAKREMRERRLQINSKPSIGQSSPPVINTNKVPLPDSGTRPHGWDQTPDLNSMEDKKYKGVQTL